MTQNVTINYGWHSPTDREGNFSKVEVTVTKYTDESALFRGDAIQNRRYRRPVEVTAQELGFLVAIAKDMGITIPTVEITESMKARW